MLMKTCTVQIVIDKKSQSININYVIITKKRLKIRLGENGKNESK